MTKTIALIASFFLILILMPSCKKCFTCVNTCSTCTYTDTSGRLSTLNLCSDSLPYTTIVDTLVAHGYRCTKAASTYTDDWCVNNKSAVGQYLPYHEGNGRYTCTQK